MLKMNRRSAISALAVAGGTLLGAVPARQAAAAPEGLGKLKETTPPRPLPEIGFTDAAGNAVGPKDFAGKGLVINLWATWCPPCVAEMPALDRLHTMLEPEGITVLPLSSDRGGREKVEPFYERTGIRNLGIWLDPRGAAMRALGARGLPTTVIVDREGREVARLEGAAAWDSPELVAAIRRLVGGGAAPSRPDQQST